MSHMLAMSHNEMNHTGSEDSGVDDVRSVGGSDDEDVLLGAHSVHFSQNLIDDTIRCSTGITTCTTT